MGAMPDASPRPRPSMSVATPHGLVGLHLSLPAGSGPWPGVVVIHDAAGMTGDVVRQCDWLASQGFLAAAPDLLRGGTVLGCLRDVITRYATWQGRIFEQVEAVRGYLAGRSDCTGRVGVIGFCLGGGFALGLAPRGAFDAASVNYGMLPKDAARALAGSCPIVGSYGGRDRTLRGAADQLRTALEANDVSCDIKEYPDAGHGFINDHARGEVPFLFQLTGPLMGLGYQEASAEDARRRITEFFREHLR